jgi:hypothetical protein
MSGMRPQSRNNRRPVADKLPAMMSAPPIPN